MKQRIVTIRNRQTGELKKVKSYGSGWICASGNFYHKSQWEFVQVVEV